MPEREIRRLLRRYRELRGAPRWQVLKQGADKLWVYACAPIVARRRGNATFECLGRSYPYHVHHYNATWRNERSVEIPLALAFLAQNHGKRVLELGNVMAYYADGINATKNPKDASAQYDVVDKYERSPGVNNVDFLSFQPPRLYDAFLSISTIEHIGWDETPRDPDKVVRALEHIPKVVSNKAEVLVSFPLGYNSRLDEFVRSGSPLFQQSSFLVRINRRNDWRETSLNEALQHRYDERFNAANALFVGRGLN